MTISVRGFAYVCELVRRTSGISLTPGKEYLVENRLVSLAGGTDEAALERLVDRLRTTPDGPLHVAVVEALTTNETSWFRDHQVYEALEKVILPEMLRLRAAERRLSIWSAGSSSGQEAYSIAMLLQDQLAAHPGWQARVVATDLSGPMVERMRAGRYSQLEINRGLPVARLVRHFRRVGTEWQVNDSLRRLLDVRELNLARPFPALPAMDVIFLRNVLIYFDLPTKRSVLAQLRRVLRPDGYLVLGGAESTLNVDAAYVRVPLGHAAIYRFRTGQAAA